MSAHLDDYTKYFLEPVYLLQSYNVCASKFVYFEEKGLHDICSCKTNIDNIQGGFFYWFRPKSVEDGKIPTKKVKTMVCHRESVKF